MDAINRVGVGDVSELAPAADELGRLCTPIGVRILLSSTPTEFRRGDLLFGNRLSSLQAVMNVSADPWTHSAIVGRVGGALATIEVGPKGCFSRSIADFVAAYRYVGLGRLQMDPECVDAAACEAEERLKHLDLAYSWYACALVEAAALARRFGTRNHEGRLVEVARRLADRLDERQGPRLVTCSGFVAQCVDAACAGCWPAPNWPYRSRIVPWRAPTTVTDLRPGARIQGVCSRAASRLLTSPSDLWVSVPFEYRSVIRADLTTVLLDLSSVSASRRPHARGDRKPKGGVL